MPGKKLINDPDSTVDEALSGLVASRHNLALIEGRRVVVVKDLADLKGRVAVICGGGSGIVTNTFLFFIFLCYLHTITYFSSTQLLCIFFISNSQVTSPLLLDTSVEECSTVPLLGVFLPHLL